jgi:hypothetical protein
LRPTWHFVLPEDIRWMLELTGPRVLTTNTHYARQVGVLDLQAEGQRVVARALEPGEHLTRPELQAKLAEYGIHVERGALAYILMHAELNAVICSGQLRGKQHTYALVEQQAPAARRLSRDEALAELTRRYFTSHGPATINDFRWWSSLTVGDIRRGLDMLGPDVHQFETNGTRYVVIGSTETQPRAASPAVILLQGYDEYFVGYVGESKYVLDLMTAGREVNRPPGPGLHVVICDSQVVGRWQRSVRNDDVAIETSFRVDLDEPARAALASAAERYGAFMQRKATLA